MQHERPAGQAAAGSQHLQGMTAAHLQNESQKKIKSMMCLCDSRPKKMSSKVVRVDRCMCWSAHAHVHHCRCKCGVPLHGQDKAVKPHLMRVLHERVPAAVPVVQGLENLRHGHQPTVVSMITAALLNILTEIQSQTSTALIWACRLLKGTADSERGSAFFHGQ